MKTPGCKLAEEFAYKHEEIRCAAAIDREIGQAIAITTEMLYVMQERLCRFEDIEPDARMIAEWVLTVAADGTDVKAAARRYLSGTASEFKVQS